MKKFLSGLLIAGALLLAGCSGVLEEPTLPASSGTTGTVLVQIGSPAAARTLAPDASGIVKHIVRYARGSSAPTGEWTEATVVDGTTSINLEPGQWTFEAIGYADADKKQAVASGSTTVTVEKGKVATAAILLTKGGDTNVAGKFSYNVDWTAINNDRITSLSLTLSPNTTISDFTNVGTVTRDLLHGITTTATGETIAWPTTTHVTGTLDLPSGVYNMDIALTVGGDVTINDETTVAHRTEVVYIYSYLTTSTPAYVFTDIDIQKLHLIGPKPVLSREDGTYATAGDYVAQSFSLYNSDGDIIPFYRTNDGTTTETSYSVTGLSDSSTWEVYIPGYAVNSTVIPNSTTIQMATRYSGISNPVWRSDLAIETKQGSVYERDDLETYRRSVTVQTAYIPGSATSITAPQFNDGGGWYTTTHYVPVGHPINVRTSIGASSNYKVSYIDVTDDSGTLVSGTLNPSLVSDTAAWNIWQDYTVPSSGSSPITVTVHYFHTGDVVRGSHNINGTYINEYNPNAEYTIAYVNSGAEHAGTLSSFTVLDAQNNTPTTAYSAYTNRGPDYRDFALTTIDELGKVLAQSRINALRFVTTSPARYWSSSRGDTSTVYYYSGPSSYLPTVLNDVYLYKDNSISTNRVAGPTIFTALNLWDTTFRIANTSSTTYYSTNTGTNGFTPAYVYSDAGYVQLVKTVDIP